MPLVDKIDEYVAIVCQQIRWKKARQRVSSELKCHILDERDAYIKQGLDEETATDKAILNTGDSITIGTQLDRVHRPKPQWEMFAWIIGLLLFGLSIGYFVFDDINVAHRLHLTAISLIVMLCAYFVDFTILGKYPRAICFAVALLMLIVFNINRHATFLFAFAMSFQLQVLALALPVVFAPIICISRNKRYLGLLGCLFTYALLCLVSMGTPMLSGFLHFSIIGVVLLFIAVMKNWFGVGRAIGLFVTITPLFVLAITVLFNAHWQSARLMAVINPGSDPLGFGFIALQVRELLSGAVLIGEGAIPKFFPHSMFYTDFILSTIIIRYGWLVFMVIMGLLLLFISKVVLRCFMQKSSLGFFVSIAVALTIFVQFFMYFIYNIGFTITHISLPFISPNNSAMLINMGLVGFMLSVFRTGDVIVD